MRGDERCGDVRGEKGKEDKEEAGKVVRGETGLNERKETDTEIEGKTNKSRED